jgi:hypothetical protein
VNHLGQRLSALIDGELESSERERVLLHMAKCGSCRDEVSALRTLKRRMNGLRGEAAAGAGLTGRLMGLSELMGLHDSRLSGGMQSGETVWPPPPPPGGWPAQDHPSQDAKSAARGDRPDQRGSRFFLAGSVAIFLAGLGTAAVIAGGEPQAQAPAPPVTPSVDVLVAPRGTVNQAPTGGPGPAVLQTLLRLDRSDPGDPPYLPGQP